MFKLTPAMLKAGNAPYEAQANAALAAEIRAFRPGPVSNLSDKQLAWVVGRSRNWAGEFGVNDPNVIKHWVMVDTLLTPCFFTMPMVAQHFQQAFGDADTKARDVLQLIKITLRENGRGSEVWW